MIEHKAINNRYKVMKLSFNDKKTVINSFDDIYIAIGYAEALLDQGLIHKQDFNVIDDKGNLLTEWAR